MYIAQDVPLAPLTTLRIGGPAKFFAAAESVDDVREALAFAEERSLAVLILGGGSNVLIADEGFDGLVIHTDLRGITIESEDDDAVEAVVGDEDVAPAAEDQQRELALLGEGEGLAHVVDRLGGDEVPGRAADAERGQRGK